MADLRVIARLGLSPYGRPLLSSSGPWTAVRAATSRVHCFLEGAIAEILCFPEDITALELRRCAVNSANSGPDTGHRLVVYSIGGRVWVREMRPPPPPVDDAGGPRGTKRRQGPGASAAEEQDQEKENISSSAPAAPSQMADPRQHQGSPAKAKRPLHPGDLQGQAMLESPGRAACNEYEDPGARLEGERLPLTVTEYQELACVTVVPRAEGVCIPGAFASSVHRVLALQVCWAALNCRSCSSSGFKHATAASTPGTSANASWWTACARGDCPRGFECLTAAPRAALSGQVGKITCSVTLSAAALVDKDRRQRVAGARRDSLMAEEESQLSSAPSVEPDWPQLELLETTAVQPELFAAIPAVTCGNLPPSYLVTGDEQGYIRVRGPPGTPLGGKGVLVADLKQPVVALLAACLFEVPGTYHQGQNAAVADALVAVGAAGRAVAFVAQTTSPRTAEQQQPQRHRITVLRDWRLHAPVTSVTAAGAKLLYAAAGQLYVADMVIRDAPGPAMTLVQALRSQKILCCKSPMLLSAAPCSPAGAHVNVLLASGALAKLSVLPTGGLASNNTQGGYNDSQAGRATPAALQGQVKGLLLSLKDTEAMAKPLKETVQFNREQLAFLAPSLHLLRDQSAAHGISVRIMCICKRSTSSISAPDRGGACDLNSRLSVVLNVELALENRSSNHSFPNAWHLITSAVSSCNRSHHGSQGSVQVPLPQIPSGQTRTMCVRLKIDCWRGSGILRAYLCTRSAMEPEQTSSDGLQIKTNHRDPTNIGQISPICALLLETRIDEVDLTGRSFPSQNAVIGEAIEKQDPCNNPNANALARGVSVSNYPEKKVEHTVSWDGGRQGLHQPPYIANTRDCQVGQMLSNPTLVASCASGQRQLDFGGEMSIPKKLRIRSCILARFLQNAAASSPIPLQTCSANVAPENMFGNEGADLQNGDIIDKTKEPDSVCGDEQILASLRAVERQLQALRDALGGIKMLKALSHETEFQHKQSELVGVLQDRAHLIQRGTIDALQRIRNDAC